VNLATEPSIYLDLDYVVVSRYTNTAQSTSVVSSAVAVASSTANAPATTATRSASKTPGAIAGALVGLVIFVLVLWAVLMRMRRRGRAHAGAQMPDVRETRLGAGDALLATALIVHPFEPSPAPLPPAFSPPTLVAGLSAPSPARSECVRRPARSS
jgi:hypothetical protein